MREEELTTQLIALMGQINLNQIGLLMKFEDELKRHNKFHRSVLGIAESSPTHKDIDLPTYAKYVLREGTTEEKRELMGCFKSKIKVTKGVVTIEAN